MAYFGNDAPHTLTHHFHSDSKTYTFQYDQRTQLTSATVPSGYLTSAYSYNDAGRLTHADLDQSPHAAGTELKTRDIEYQYSDPDPERVTALLEAGTSTHYATYTFDEAGNQTSRCYGATYTPTCAGESVEFVYDGNDHLRRAVKKQNGVVVSSEEYFYGNGGQRFAVVSRDNNGSNTEMTWFIGDVEAHYTNTGAVSHVYSHLSLGTPVARVDRTGPTSTDLELHFHGLANNLLASIAYDGTVRANFRYSPFGEVIESQGTAPDSLTRRFNDKRQDAASDLHYYGYRYYDPISLIWTQADPMLRFIPDAIANQPRRANLYTNDLNNPLRFLDPDGLNAGAWGFHQFMNECGQGSLCETGSLIEGGGWGGFSDEGGTWDNALRDLIQAGIAKKRPRVTELRPPELRGDAHETMQVHALHKIHRDDLNWLQIKVAVVAFLLFTGGEGLVAEEFIEGEAVEEAIEVFPVAESGGEGAAQEYGQVSIGPNGMRVAPGVRGPGGLSHAALGSERFGPLAVGEPRYGWTKVNGVNTFQKLSGTIAPTAEALPRIRQALNALGETNNALALIGGQWIPF